MGIQLKIKKWWSYVFVSNKIKLDMYPFIPRTIQHRRGVSLKVFVRTEDFSWSLIEQQFVFNSTFDLNLMWWKCTQAVYWLWIDNIHNVMTRRKNVNLVTVVGFACDCEYKMKGKFQSRLHKLLLHFHVAQCISISSATYNLNSYVPRRFFTYQR